ncbi:MAG: glycine cleavage system protein T [Chloroflexota bacterium]|nr:glycine cleavage system protein T [Chloroflexota bacterium]
MALTTPLFPLHQRLGAKFLEFGGWNMPLQYSGIVQEHRAVRAAAGLFDISHMGKLEVWGPAAFDFLQELTANDVARLKVFQAQYSFLLDTAGGVIDDLVVVRLEDHFLLVVNAGPHQADIAWLREDPGEWRQTTPRRPGGGEFCAEKRDFRARGRGSRAANGFDTTLLRPGVELRDRTEELAMLALQGPKAEELLQRWTDLDLAAIRYYRAAEGAVAGERCLVSRSGYTGEDGFELIVAAERAGRVWQALLDGGARACGLGARDTLRLEAGMALYGHELDRQTTPLEAGLDRFVAMDKPDFVGKAALEASRDRPRKRLAGFRMLDRAVPRSGYPVYAAEKQAGLVTSGSYAPTLDACIGLAYVAPEAAAVGREISVAIRNEGHAATIVPVPFYRRPK